MANTDARQCVIRPRRSSEAQDHEHNFGEDPASRTAFRQIDSEVKAEECAVRQHE